MKMFKVLMFGTIAVVLFVSSSFHSVCAQPSTVAPATNTTKSLWEGLSLSIQLAQSKAQPQKTQPQVDVDMNQPVGVYIIFKNTSAQEHTLPLSMELNRSAITLKNNKGEAVPLTRYGQRNLGKSFLFAEVSPIRLKSGEEYRYLFVLNRFFDMTENGTYYLTIKYKAPLYYGPQSSLPKGMMPGTDGDEPKPRIRWFKPSAVDAMPNPLHNKTILIPAPENAANVPEIVSNLLAVEVNDQPMAWTYQGETRRVD